MKKAVLIFACVIICFCLITGCSGKSTTIDAKSLPAIQVTGLNSRGKLEITDHTGATVILYNYRTNNKNVKDSQYADLVKALESMKFQVISDKTENLSNGDEIRIKTLYDETLINNAKIKIENEEFTYTVSGLAEGIPIDLFAEIELVYESVSPYARVEVVNRSEKQYVRDIRYEVEPFRNLRIGDNIVVTAKLNADDAESKGFIVPDILTKEYTVENIDEYVKNFNDIDQTSKDKLKKEATDRIESACAEHYGSALGPLELLTVSFPNIKFGEPELVNIYFNVLKPGASDSLYNNIFYVYKISATHPDIAETRIAYAAIQISNIIIKADGTIDVDLNQNIYTPIFASNKDLDGVYSQVVTAQKNLYEIQEIAA